MRSFLVLIGLLSLVNTGKAQFKEYGRELVDTLCSPFFFGRGYVQEGCSRAAYFIAHQFDQMGVKPLFNEYFQEFPLTVNTFPYAVNAQFDGRELVPGRDFQPHSESGSGKGSFSPVYLDTNSGAIPELKKNDAIMIPAAWLKKIDAESRQQTLADLAQNHVVVIEVGAKLTWTVGHGQFGKPVIEVLSNNFWGLKKVRVNIEAVIEANYYCNNVCATVRGTQYPDSFLYLTAHYDHLGGMGAATYIPGANDNASGTAMLLALAKYFKENPPKYSVAFIAFAGEEAGLVGSNYFVENAGASRLSKIKFLFNLDLMGTGAEGATVVNATVFPNQFEQLKRVNDTGHYLSVINSRGEAANSDHYWFTKKGVPSFFMYLQDANYTAYHNIHDRPQDLPLTRFDATCKLIIDFFNSF